MRIAVFSGSFNPLHYGHLAILRHLVEVEDFDMTYLVVSPQNPFKSKDCLENAQSRLNAAIAVIDAHPELNTKVEDIEMKRGAPQYTIDTLDALREREPLADFSLVIGSDNLVRLKGWRSYQRLLSQYGVYVYPRPGFDPQELSKPLLEECSAIGIKYKIHIMDAPMHNISSTEIREARARGEETAPLI